MAIVPGRLASSRFPRKLLVEIQGIPLLAYVLRNVKQARHLRDVRAAVDSRELQEAAASVGVQAWITPPDLPSGTDRLAYVVRQTLREIPPFVLNVQGDEPLLTAHMIDRFLEAAAAFEGEWEILTLVTDMESEEALHSPHTVKVARDHRGYALYFSRSVIPYPRRRAPLDAYVRHVGMYLYTREALLRWPELKEGHLEKIEQLEQLRALEAGWRIATVHIPGLRLQAVDTPEDLEKVRSWLKGSS
jgi:3-deoxy-manno-octulosonate cytidylyltransferase (CMP-KDO synthetase)